MQVDNVKTTSPQPMQANTSKGGKGIARNYVVLCNCVAGNWDGHINVSRFVSGYGTCQVRMSNAFLKDDDHNFLRSFETDNCEA
jgi:hypothetical protein